jgi:hypothetical protein
MDRPQIDLENKKGAFRKRTFPEVFRKAGVIACGAGPSTQLNRGTPRAAAGPGPPYTATRPRFFSYSLALPRPAVPQLRPAGARGMRGVRLALSCQEAWY